MGLTQWICLDERAIEDGDQCVDEEDLEDRSHFGHDDRCSHDDRCGEYELHRPGSLHIDREPCGTCHDGPLIVDACDCPRPDHEGHYGEVRCADCVDGKVWPDRTLRVGGERCYALAMQHDWHEWDQLEPSDQLGWVQESAGVLNALLAAQEDSK